MHFAFIARDKPDSLDLRMATRPAHLAFIQDLNSRGLLTFGGPFLDENEKPCGSLLILDVDSADAVRKLMAGDPYAKAGLFASTEVQRWNWTLNNPGAKA